MFNIHPWYSQTEFQIMEELGSRLKSIRLNRNITQQELANQIGKDVSEISRMERGNPITMISFLRILRALNKLESIEKAIQPPPAISPIALSKMEKNKKQRASSKRNK